MIAVVNGSRQHMKLLSNWLPKVPSGQQNMVKLLCKCRFLILFFMYELLCFLTNRTIFVKRDKLSTGLLLSSSGPKENIFPSNFIYT